MFQDMIPKRRKNSRFHRAIEQRRVADRSLTVLDAPRGGRLRHVEACGRPGHRPRFSDRDKGLDILQVHKQEA